MIDLNGEWIDLIITSSLFLFFCCTLIEAFQRLFVFHRLESQ
jgi:hypothetical protein